MLVSARRVGNQRKGEGKTVAKSESELEWKGVLEKKNLEKDAKPKKRTVSGLRLKEGGGGPYKSGASIVT